MIFKVSFKVKFFCLIFLVERRVEFGLEIKRGGDKCGRG